MAINDQTQYEGYKTEAKAQATRVGIKVKAKASKVEASIGSMRPLHNRGRSLYDVDGPLVGQWRRPMKQRRLRWRKARDAAGSLCLYGNIHGICLSCQRAEM